MNEIKQTLQQDADALLKRLQQSRKNGTGVTLSVSDVGVLCEALGGGGWISVDAAKPNRNKKVLLSCNLRRNYLPIVCVGFWSAEPFEEPVFVLDDEFTELKGVTHWMPLPKPPVKEAEGD